MAIPLDQVRTELVALRAEVAALTARDATRAGELAALRVEVGALKVALHLQAHDRDWLQVVAEATRATSFTAQTLLARAEEHRRLQQALAGMNARAIGARLKRLARRPPVGFMLTQDGRDNSGCIWTLSHLDAGGAAAGGI
jgi:hypothetical protein